MNIVAHQLLSYKIPDIQLGNVLGEIVRGKDYQNYPQSIATGILLHRHIDSFTDSHPIVKQTTSIFHKSYGKFAPIITDVIYDYFLIKNWYLFSNDEFETFKKSCYELVIGTEILFPKKLEKILNTLIEDDWFDKYRTYEGIEWTLHHLTKKSKFNHHIADMGNSIKEIYLQEKKIENHFLEFFPQLEIFCKKFIIRLMPEYEVLIQKNSVH
ncbi:ACP phosphodiesterase [Apibacter sp.]|uniref:acyl carrier protein phosphodiesterase n=1 Tax=Apibacter sp. TaxID=2023709 RepID=UPI0025ED3AE9|nr:ACP phosphodiesterase [Apibacter sp.]MCT6869599.1 ACP phosphodiesterase [Apibacter sp.]